MSPRASHDERERAITLLANVNTPTTTLALKRAAQDLDKPLRLMASGVLLSRNDMSMLAVVEDALLHPPPEIDSRILRGLAGFEGVKAPQAIPSLARLLRAGDVYTRRGAVRALRFMETDAAIEPLSTALEDTDSEVRYNAVFGLAMITQQYEWAPSIEHFERNEQRYLTYWKEWRRNR